MRIKLVGICKKHFEYQVTHTKNVWQRHQYQKFVQRNANALKYIQGELVEDKRGD